jgi:ABC-type transport system substrate-binding protein
MRLLVAALALIVFPIGVTAAAGKPYLAGGVGFFNLAFDPAPVDPATTYSTPGWQIEYATCAKLVNYPDAAAPDGSQPQLGVAKKVTISPDGLTYTFRLRNEYVFSPPSNARVTADAFARALDRVRDPVLQSPGQPFFADVVSTTSDGDKTLMIRLAHPSGSFLARLALPFACAVPPETPSAPSVVPLPSAGPYYVSGYTAGSRIVLSRNPNYVGPRPANLDQILIQTNVDPGTTLSQIESRTADYAMSGLATSASYACVASTYPAQFFVNPYPGFRYLALNTSRPIFSTPAARQAVNLAINRTALLAQVGAFAGTPDDQYIPSGVPGYLDTSIYPLNGPSASDLAQANALVDQAGIRGQTAVLYSSTSAVSQAMAALVRDELAQIGLGVDIHAFPRGEQITRESTRGEPFDIAGNEGWIDDYLDPADTLNNLFDGTTIGPVNNLDISYLNDPAINARLQAAELLTGPARYAAYGQLDVDLAQNYAPLATLGTYNARDFFSVRIGCQTYNPAYGMDLAELCVKR